MPTHQANKFSVENSTGCLGSEVLMQFFLDTFFTLNVVIRDVINHKQFHCLGFLNSSLHVCLLDSLFKVFYPQIAFLKQNTFFTINLFGPISETVSTQCSIEKQIRILWIRIIWQKGADCFCTTGYGASCPRFFLSLQSSHICNDIIDPVSCIESYFKSLKFMYRHSPSCDKRTILRITTLPMTIKLNHGNGNMLNSTVTEI